MRFLMIISLLFLKGISPDVVTYSTLMKAHIRARKFDKVGTLEPTVDIQLIFLIHIRYIYIC